jgi:hypothetical protein
VIDIEQNSAGSCRQATVLFFHRPSGNQIPDAVRGWHPKLGWTQHLILLVSCGLDLMRLVDPDAMRRLEVGAVPPDAEWHDLVWDRKPLHPSGEYGALASVSYVIDDDCSCSRCCAARGDS